MRSSHGSTQVATECPTKGRYEEVRLMYNTNIHFPPFALDRFKIGVLICVENRKTS